MRARPFALLSLAAALGVASWWRIEAGRVARATGLPREGIAAAEAAPAAPSYPGVPAGARVVEFLQPERAAASAGLRAAPVDLPADDAALVAETAALQLLARDTQLELNARQWSAFAAVALEFQAVRAAYEAELARSIAPRDGKQRIEIPAYPVAGDRLREKFQAALVEALGAENAAEIRRELGSKLEGYFAGFGVGAQTLEFAGLPARTGDFQVTRTVHYWNSIEGGAALSLRRETCFPALEDPTGATWAPLLERMAHLAGGGTGG